MTTISARIARGRDQLIAAGVEHDEAALDARLLAQLVLAWDATRILTAGNQREPAGFDDRYDALILRRARHEPLAYITGTREFWNLSFDVSPAVLIPRPETEGLVEAALTEFPQPDEARRVIDLCTGSGCVAIALAVERPRWQILATDMSAAALDVARRNAAKHTAAGRIAFEVSDLLRAVEGRFDLVLANPPYVPASDASVLPPEVRDYEPATALFGGSDGLDVIRQLIAEAPPHLEPDGWLMFEFGDGQHEAVQQLISNQPTLKMIAIKRDLQGIARIAIARRLDRSTGTPDGRQW